MNWVANLPPRVKGKWDILDEDAPPWWSHPMKWRPIAPIHKREDLHEDALNFCTICGTTLDGCAGQKDSHQLFAWEDAILVWWPQGYVVNEQGNWDWVGSPLEQWLLGEWRDMWYAEYEHTHPWLTPSQMRVKVLVEDAPL